MLDNNDIEKLIKAQKKVFATKEDLADLKEVFVTKEEFEGFMEIAATKDDIAEIRKEMATKDDLKATNTNINKIVEILGKMDKKLDEVVQTSKEVEYIKNTIGIPALKKI